MNFAETSRLQKEFSEKGWEIVSPGENCDLAVVNTCTVTGRADADSRKTIRRIARKNPDAFIAVTGCYAQLRSEEILKIEGVDAVLGNEEKFRIFDIIGSIEKKNKPEIHLSEFESWKAHSACSIDNESHTRIVMKIQDGCDYKCTYCAVPHARGPSRSVSLGEIKSLIKETKEAGFYEIVLSGINLGGWKENEKRFIDVLKMIEEMETGKIRFRISSVEPNLLNDEIIGLVSRSKKICPHFHIPLQSGADEVLKLMKRRYSADLFRERILKINELIPGCGIGADIITGFPGETEEYFKKSYDLIESLPVSYLHVFTYSERKGTEAFDMENQVPHIVRKERTLALRELSDKKKNEFYTSHIGGTKTVIPEEYNSKTGLWQGWTEDYIRVKFPAPPDFPVRPVKIILKKTEEGFVKAEVL